MLGTIVLPLYSMRHTKFSITQRYIHPDREAALNAVNSRTLTVMLTIDLF